VTVPIYFLCRAPFTPPLAGALSDPPSANALPERPTTAAHRITFAPLARLLIPSSPLRPGFQHNSAPPALPGQPPAHAVMGVAGDSITILGVSGGQEARNGYRCGLGDS